MWTIVERKPQLWLIPLTIVLISMGWWENYICVHSPLPFIKKLGKIKQHFIATRYFTHIFISIWKCLCFFLSIIVITLIKESEVGFFFSDFSKGFSGHPITILEVKFIIALCLH